MKTADVDLIVEIGQNHNGDMGVAKELIQSAAAAGAKVAKFQLFDARKLFPIENNPWFEYNCKAELSREQMFQIVEWCREYEIEFMASVFDTERLTWLEELGVKRHKVASRSVRDAELVKAVVATRKPVLVSLGMWEGDALPDLGESAGQIGFLHCVSKYPAPLDEVNLSRIDFSQFVGYSDHTMGISAALAAVARGAQVIEKHFTLDQKMTGPDHSCSMNPEELSVLVKMLRDIRKVLQ